jgi:hypothetical protein
MRLIKVYTSSPLCITIIGRGKEDDSGEWEGVRSDASSAGQCPQEPDDEDSRTEHSTLRNRVFYE